MMYILALAEFSVSEASMLHHAVATQVLDPTVLD